MDPRKLPRPTVNYYPDALERTPGIEDTLRLYDGVFTSVRPTPDWMEWLPTGWDPSIHVDKKVERELNTVYVGTKNSDYKKRMVMGISPQVLYGNGWANSISPRYLHDLVDVLNKAKVLIDVHQSPHVGVNRKFFEMISCGLTIVDRVPGVMEILGEVFGLLVTYTNVDEARSLIDYFLKNPEEREKVWSQQREKIQEFTYRKAAEKILGPLNLR